MEELHGEKCGVFGVYGKGLDVARLTYFGLYALQHRGQESSGIATSDGSQLYSHVGMGLVSQVFNESDIEKLPGFLAMGHNRYSTAGGSRIEHAQPILINDGEIALAHNGNLPSATALVSFLAERHITVKDASDSRLMAEAIGAIVREGKSLADAIRVVYPYMTGAFS